MKAAYKKQTHTKADVGEGESHSYDFPENNVFGGLFLKDYQSTQKGKNWYVLIHIHFFRNFLPKRSRSSITVDIVLIK